MPEPYTYHWPNNMALFCSGAERLGLAEATQRHGADLVVSDMTEPGGQR